MKTDRVVRYCAECGVEFLGKPKQRFCPMHLHEHYLQSKKRHREWHKENGWCYDCGKEAAPGHTRCSECLKKLRDSYNRRVGNDVQKRKAL